MAFLVVGGVTVKVDPSSSRRVEVPVGSVRRAFSGKPRSSVSSYRAEWTVETVLISRSAANSLRTALKATPPVAVSGDLTGSVNVYCSGIAEVGKARLPGGEYVRLAFTMMAET